MKQQQIPKHSIRYRYLFMADNKHKLVKGMNIYQTWVTHAFSSTAGPTRPQKTIKMTVLDGTLTVHNHPNAPKPKQWDSSIQMGVGDTVILWENIEHAVEATSKQVRALCVPLHAHAWQ